MDCGGLWPCQLACTEEAALSRVQAISRPARTMLSAWAYGPCKSMGRQWPLCTLCLAVSCMALPHDAESWGVSGLLQTCLVTAAEGAEGAIYGSHREPDRAPHGRDLGLYACMLTAFSITHIAYMLGLLGTLFQQQLPPVFA